MYVFPKTIYGRWQITIRKAYKAIRFRNAVKNVNRNRYRNGKVMKYYFTIWQPQHQELQRNFVRKSKPQNFILSFRLSIAVALQ